MDESKSFPSLIFFIRLGLFELIFLTPLLFYGWATTFSSVKQTFAQIGCLALLSGLSFELFFNKSTFSSPPFLTLFIIFFSAFSVISSIWSASLYASFLGLGVWGVFFTVYFLTFKAIENERWVKILLIGVVSAGFLAAAYSFFQFYGAELPIWKQLTSRLRLFSTFGNPNYLAGYLVAALHLGVLLFFIQKKWKFLWLIIIGILYASCLMTYARGAWVALFFSSFFVLVLLFFYRGDFFKRNKLSVVLLAMMIFVISLIFLFPNPLNLKKINLVERSVSVVSPKASSSHRFLIWQSALELIKEKPILGWGVGTFGVHYPSAQGRVLSREENKNYLTRANRSINAHNDYLQIWAEEGLIGLSLFLGIIGLFYWKLFSFLRKNIREKTTTPCLFLIFLSGGITSFLIHALVSFPFHIIQNGMVFWLFLALAAGIIQGKIKWRKGAKDYLINEVESTKKLFFTQSKVLLRWVALLLIISGASYLSFWRMKIFISDLNVKQGQLFMETDAYFSAKKQLEKAVKINPYNAQAFADLTRIYSYQGLYQDVINSANRAELNWNIPNIHNRKAFAYLKLGKMEEARKALSTCIFLYPNFSAGYSNFGYLNLLEAETNIKQGNLKVAEKRLDNAFLYYVQGNIWNSQFSLPEKLSLVYQEYHKLAEKEQKNKDKLSIKEILPSFSFFPRDDYLLVFLSYLTGPKKHFYLNALIYAKKNVLSANEDFSLQIEIKDEEKLFWEKDFLNLNLSSACPAILKFKVEKEISSGEYIILARLVSKGNLLFSEEVRLRCFIREKEAENPIKLGA